LPSEKKNRPEELNVALQSCWLEPERTMRPILNFTPRGKLWPQGRICLPGVHFVPWVWVKVSPGGEIHCLPLHSSKL
jgi:hypothetical protein